MQIYGDVSSGKDVFNLIAKEEVRQRESLELIASENFASRAVLAAMGTVLNNRYAEGYPGNRYYGGQEYLDQIEELAITRAKGLFRSRHANVQPHSGASANVAAYFAVAKPGDTIMGMDLSHGGHLTHGDPVTHIAKLFKFCRYRMADTASGAIDYDAMRDMARSTRPRIILAGYSAYPREMDYKIMREIADEVGAVAMADVAHTAGLIVGGVLKNPLDYGFDILLSTTHKTLRGPRGGLIVAATEEFGRAVDRSVFPSFQGGPIMQNIAAKAVAFEEASTAAFKRYAAMVLANAKELAKQLMDRGVTLVTNGTDNHLILIDSVASWGITGGQAQGIADAAGITLNKNRIPDDPRNAQNPSGVRIGTPALTSRPLLNLHQQVYIIAHVVNESA